MTRIEISEEMRIMRIDQLLNQEISDLSRSFCSKLIEDGRVSVDGKVIRKPSSKLKEGKFLEVDLPEPEEIEVMPEDIPLDILYEDNDVILINKPKNMVVHPAPGHYSGTLVNALLFHCKDSLSGINGQLRPGIVHRIDRDTTGVIIACKNDRAHNSLAEQLKEHSITRKYHAIVCGKLPKEEGMINAPIGRSKTDRKKMTVTDKNSKRAVTHYRVIERFNQYTYVECILETGRTHQIRVHMSYIGHPVLGDTVYGPKNSPFALEGQTLHAEVLGFIHPQSGEYMEFTAPLPEYFKHLLNVLRQKKN